MANRVLRNRIVLAVHIQQEIPELLPLLQDGSVCKESYNHLSRKRQFSEKKEGLFNGSSLSTVGRLRKYVLTVIACAVVEQFAGPVAEVFQFKRFLIGTKVIHSRAYKYMTRRNNYTVNFKAGNGEFGSVYSLER